MIDQRSMEIQLWSCLAGALLIFLWYVSRLWLSKPNLNLPPAPKSLPLIGHMHLLVKGLPHHVFARLSKQYGDIIFLQLGRIPAIVVSSPELAREVLKNQDQTFASRPYTTYGQYFTRNQDMALAPFDEHWKNMRKLCTTELFTVRRIESFTRVRMQELTHMMTALLQVSSSSSSSVEIRSLISVLNFNTITSILISKRFLEYNSDEENDTKEFKKHNDELVAEALTFHIGDCVPQYLRWIDWTIPRIIHLHDKQHKFMKTFVDEIRSQAGQRDSQGGTNFMEIMLEFTKDEPHGDEIVQMMVLELIIAGTDTSSNVLEWALAELVLQPDKLKKCQEEMDRVVGCARMVTDSDIKQLEYFQAVIKETLRLHPPTGILVPHMSTQACEVGGYDIPKGTTTFVNVYAIGRDPRLWENASEFKPERFLTPAGKTLDFKGRDFQLLPFGSGRRACPGMILGVKTVELVLSNLLHGFHWSSPPGEIPSLEEFNGTVSWMKTPLKVLCTPRYPDAVYKSLVDN